MNIQTERLEDQTARVTVEIDAARLDAAKQKAARQISGKVNIPGFRKGKVPYRVLLNYVGEAAILEDAVELLSQEVYKEVLPQTDLEPYGPGILTDVKSELPTPTFTYVIPLQPSVDLKDFHSIRAPYEEPEVTDEEVTRSMKNLQEQNAVVEESRQPAARSNRVTIDLHSYVIGEHEEAEDAEETDAEVDADEVVDAEAVPDAVEAVEPTTDEHEDDADDHEEEHDHEHDHEHAHGGEGEDEGTPYIHEHDLELILDEDGEPTPGFSEAMVGAVPGDSRVFVLTFPDDAEKYEEMAGKTVRYYVDTKKVETLTLPALTDDFAARVTKDEEKPLTLLELRIRARENLTTTIHDNYRNEYVRKALDQVVQQAEIKYPEAMIADQVDTFLRDFDQRLRQQGITLQDYMKIYQKTADDLYNDYREPATQTVRRSLVLREIASIEHLTISEEQVDAQIEIVVAQFAEDRHDTIRQMFTTQPTMRDSVRSDLLRDAVLDRIIAIAKGDVPAIPTTTTPEPPQPSEVTSETKEESA